jgi:hypothetical protein
VTGYFDPMLAAHAARLKEIASNGGPVVVVIRDPEQPLLPAEARAYLVAGLAGVDHVMIAPAGAALELPDTVRVFREEDSDSDRRRELIRYVHTRQAAE